VRTAIYITQTSDVTEVDTVEDLLLGRNQLRVIDQGYQDLKLEPPGWVIDKLTEIEREITIRVKGELQRRLKLAKARRATLRTQEEKREAADAEIAELEKMLSG